MVNGDISALSDEMLLTIFAQLPRSELAFTALVCKRWLNVSYDVKLWKKVVLTRGEYEPAALEHVLERGVKELSIVNRGGNTFSRRTVFPLQRDKIRFKRPLFTKEVSESGYYPLRKFFAHNNMINEAIVAVIQRCRELHTIWLSGPAITNEICYAIGKNSQLEVLYVSWPTQAASYTGILSIAGGCQRLRRWGSNFCRLMSKEQISDLIEILSPRMESTNVLFGNDNLTDTHIAALTVRCPNLLQLNIKHCHNLTQKTIDHVKKLENLKHLDIRFCSSIPLLSLSRLRNMISLKKLYVGFDADLETQQTNAESVRRMLPNVEIIEDRDPKHPKREEYPS